MTIPWWVLVVDDDAEVNALIVEMLCDEGIAARGLTQARAAMALLEGANPPGFIIADMTMPEIGGIELVRRAERRGINGLLITAADTRHLKPGPSAPVMRKPFEVDELIRLVAGCRPSIPAALVAQSAASAA